MVVLSHERVTRLRWLLNALDEQTLPRDRWELVVVHDSTDGTEELLKTHPLARAGVLHRVRLEPGSGSPSRQRNGGWREASAPLIAFTDDDCRPQPVWLERLVEAAREHPGANRAGRDEARSLAARLGLPVAREVLDSKVERVSMSIYHATPEELGQFDLVFCGSVLIHLRDQLLALERIARLCRGTFISAEEYDMLACFVSFLVSRYRADRDKAVVYWLPSIRTWRRMLWTAGFDEIEEFGKFKMRATGDWYVRHVVHHASRSVVARS